MSSDEADALVTSNDPLHVRLFHETRTDAEIASINSQRTLFQSCVPGFIGLGGLLELEEESVSALGASCCSTFMFDVESPTLIFSAWV